MEPIKLLSLDLDGTVLDNTSRVTAATREAIRKATDAGVYVILATGRPLCGIPADQFEGLGIQYCITTNGTGIYNYETKECLYDDSMETDFIVPILEYLTTLDIHFDAYIGGDAFSNETSVRFAQSLDLPEELLKYILGTRERVPDLASYVRDSHLKVQKVTMNFYPLPDGTYKDRDKAQAYVEQFPELSCVCGGFHNLEINKKTASKGKALHILADHLGIPITQTMAIGDTENDLSIIEAAGVGVAMGNATDEVKARADLVAASNTEDGVAGIIYKYVL